MGSPTPTTEWAAVVQLVRTGLAAGLRLRPDRNYYKPGCGIRRWCATTPSGAKVVVEHWHHQIREELGNAWALEATGPAGRVETRQDLTPARAARLLAACEVLPDLEEK